jgi:hypothetical protein
MPPPVPPSVKDGPDDGREAHHGLHLLRLLEGVRERERGLSSPIFVIAFLNFSRSSALSIASRLAPIISTPNFSEHAFAREVERAVERRLARPWWAAAHPGAPSR